MRHAALALLLAISPCGAGAPEAARAAALVEVQSFSTLPQGVPLMTPTDTVTSPDGRHVYVTGRFDNAIAIYSRNATSGALTYVAGVLPVNGEGVVGIMDAAIAPDGKHLYAASYDGSAVGIYARDAQTGLLTWVGRVVDGENGVDGLAGAYSVAVSPDGQSVYVTPLGESEIAVFGRSVSTGELFFIAAVANPEFFQPKDVVVAPDSQHVYITAGAVFVYEKTGAGSLALVEKVYFPSAYRLAMAPDGHHLYVTDNNFDRVQTYAIDPFNARLSFVELDQNGVGGVTGLDFASGIAASPDGKRVYATGEVSGAVAAFARDETTGALSFLGSFYAGEGPEFGFQNIVPAVSPDGGHLYVSSYRGQTLKTFDTGRAVRVLSAVRDGDPGIDALADPRGVAVSPDGAHVYATSLSSSALNAFTRDASTGALALADVERQGQGGVDALVGAGSVAVAPDGAHVYVVAQADGAVTGFARDANATGSTHLAFASVVRDGESGVEGIGDARQLALSRDGRHVYVTSDADGFLTWFERDLVSGVLTQGGHYPFLASSGLEGIAVSPDDRFVYASVPNDQQLLVFERDDFSGSLLLQDIVSQGGSGIPLLLGPASISISGDGTRLFVACGDSDAVIAFARNPQTGLLTYTGVAAEGVGGVSGLLGVAGIAADPVRSQVYAAGAADAAITAFTTDTGVPALTDFEADGRLGVATLAGVAALAASPDGVHLYAVASTDDALVALALPEPLAFTMSLAAAATLLGLPAIHPRRRLERE